MKTVCYFGHTWGENIGNAFIDYSINYCLKEVIDSDVRIVNVSNQPSNLKYNFSERFPFSILSGKGAVSAFDLRLLTKPDVVILGGSLFDVFWSKVHIHLLNWLIEKQIPIIVLGGGGGNNYTEKEIDNVKNIWKELNVHTFISRDDVAFETFGHLFKNIYSGIDNAFFLSDLFIPTKLSVESLGVKALDLTYNRNIEFPADMKVITVGHRLASVDSIKFFFKHGLNTYKIVKQYDLISDFPDDYLHLYGNSKITHSDRVHACV